MTSKAQNVPVLAPAEVKSSQLTQTKKSKTVRKDVTLPKLEHLLLETLKLRSSKLGSPVKKNVLVRAGIQALATMSDARFLVALDTVASSRKRRDWKN